MRPWAPLIMPERLNDKTLAHMLDALTALNVDYLLEHPNTPDLYRSGIRYEAEPAGQEQWLTIPWCLLRLQQGGGADCEDLACWRVAELRVRYGERDAIPIWTSKDNGQGGRLYHIKVGRGANPNPKAGWFGSRVEDPSALLGMPIPFEDLLREHPIIHTATR